MGEGVVIFVDDRQNRTIIILFGYLVVNGILNGTLISSTTYIYLTGLMLLITIIYIMIEYRINVEIVFKTYLFLSLLSSFVLLAQTIGGANAYLFDLAAKTGLADPNESIVHGRDLLQKRGSGLSLTITDFASHNFIALYYAFYQFRENDGLNKIYYLISLVVISIAVWVNDSSAAILGVGIAILSIVAIKKHVKLRFILATFILGLILPHAIKFILDATIWGQEYYGSPIVSRFYIWSKALSVFMQSPVIGAGLGNNLQSMHELGPLFFVNFYSADIAIHSWIFDILSALGLIGLLIYIIFITNIMKQIIEIKKSNTKHGSILFLVLISNLVFGLFSNIHYMTYEYYLLAAYSYVVYANTKPQTREFIRRAYQ
jgi:hypothetical protein